MDFQNAQARTRHNRFTDLVFEGGGVKGIGLVGALSVLEEQGYQPQNLAGSSAGAIIAVLLAAGYSANELREIIRSLDFRRFSDKGWEDRIPLIGSVVSVLKDRGIYEGTTFEQYMTELLEAKGVGTFRDLVHPAYADDDNPLYHHKVQVIVSDLTDRCLLVLPKDAEQHLGIAPDDLSVAAAVRMSMSIPIFFEPVRFSNPQDRREHILVDGGMLSNFPVWLFDSGGEPEWPTFGLKLVEPEPTMVNLAGRMPPGRAERGGLVDYVKSLVQTMTEAHDRLYIEKAQFARTIPIKTLGVRTTEFNLTLGRADALYESGRTAALEFLRTWNFEAYIAEFRQGKTHHRRAEIAAELAQA
jgi:NTE family protein